MLHSIGLINAKAVSFQMTVMSTIQGQNEINTHVSPWEFPFT